MAQNPFMPKWNNEFMPNEFMAIKGGWNPAAMFNAAMQSQPSAKPSANPYDELLDHVGPKFPLPPMPPGTTVGPTTPEGQISQPTPQGGRPHAVTQPAPVAPADPFFALAQQYAQTPGYEYITPEIVKAYQQEMFSHPMFKDANVDIVDWLADRGYASPLAGRSGRDTYKAAIAAWQARQGQPQGGGPVGPAVPAVPAVPGPAAPTTPTGPQGAMPPAQEYLDFLNRALQVQQDREMRNALRGYRAAASSQGLESSGAYGAGQNELFGNLASQFGQQRAQAMLGVQEAERARQFTGGQNELDRILQKYGIDVGAATSQGNAAMAAGVASEANRIQFELGKMGYDIDRSRAEEIALNNIREYNLQANQQALAAEEFRGRQNIDLFELMARYGPEAVFQNFFGAQRPPGFIGYQG